MSPPRRRSSRLRGASATPAKSISHASNRMESLTERDETPTSGARSNLDAIVSSPLAPRTPATAGRIQPPTEQMHPSQAHHSTKKQPDSGLRLGFIDIQISRNGQPSDLVQQTSSKTNVPSATFDFRFARPVPQLGPEAQKMMDELREEALRIKAKLAAECEERKRNGEISQGSIEGRKIAQPKGKAGRFSDIHMSEFKKMDSIAGHPSAFRAQPGKLNTMGLKRKQSKAQLDDREAIQRKNEESVDQPAASERLENISPAKRPRKRATDDTSSARPVSRDDNKTLPTTPTIPLSRSRFLSFVTPTQASLARAANPKQSHSQIPTLSRSPSKPNLNATPSRLPKSATANNLGSIPKSTSRNLLRSPGSLGRVKSILRYPGSNSKKSSTMPSSVLSSSKIPGKPDLDKSLPSIPTTPSRVNVAKDMKHVNFTPDIINKYSATFQNLPSMVKSAIPRSTSKIRFGAKNTAEGKSQDNAVNYPSITGHPSLVEASKEVKYPTLRDFHGLPDPPRQIGSKPPPSVPSTFTFRSDHTISFGVSPKGFGSSPGQSSVRQVRQSIFPSTMPGSFPDGNKENTNPLPVVPHGMPNKKRRRVDSDDEIEVELEHSPKKHKTEVVMDPKPTPRKLFKQNTTPRSNVASPAKKGGIMSLSRLNMLARPKMRK